MPRKKKSEYNSYMKNYMPNWRRKRTAELKRLRKIAELIEKKA